ncbi:MAG: S8 family serine peptidase [Candidatus Aenigmarchaeota archaeon]|nr:S8 family serine peptidase [Candidatus Aenigmarchaeota archaeon]
MQAVLNPAKIRFAVFTICILVLAPLSFAEAVKGPAPSQEPDTSDLLANPEIAPGEFPAIIVLKDQPLHEISRNVKPQYDQKVDEEAKVLEEIEKKFRQLDEGQIRSLGLEKAVEYQTSALTKEEKSRMKETVEKIDSIKDMMKRDIMLRQKNLAEPQQNLVGDIVEKCGGSATGTGIVINSVFARIPKKCLQALKESGEIAAVYEDEKTFATLDKSVCATGADTFYSAGYNGTGWDVTDLDTGVDANHPALTGVVTANRTFHDTAVTDSSYRDNPNTTDDLHFHGTHVAGIIASRDSKYRGIAYGTRLINAKAGANSTTGGWMYNSDGMKAMDWAISTAGADVISRSFGLCGSGVSDCANARYLDAIVDDLDVSVANSAGNDGPSNSTVGAPGYNFFSVASQNDMNTCDSVGDTSDDAISSFSSRGFTSDGRVKPDIAAPGSSIISAYNIWETTDDFVGASGTSMATPHVSGAVALVLNYKGLKWNPIAIRALMLNSAKNATFSDRRAFGWGVMDLGEAYAQRNNVVLDNITEGAVKFYKITNMSAGNKATLEWNRHVVYNGANSPTTYYSLNDLDIYIYNESANTQISRSITGVENTEQVGTGASYSSVVVKVHAFTTNFTHNSNTEEYAVAASKSISAADPPSLSVSLGSPTAFVSQEFNFTANVANGGDLAAHNVSVNLTLTSSFLTIVSGSNPQSLGFLNASSNKTASWILTSASTGTFNFLVNASSSSYGETFNANNSALISAAAGDVTIVLASPANRTYTDTVIQLNYTLNGTAQACWYRHNNANTSLPGCANATFTVAAGANSMTVFANNTAGTIFNSSAVGFTLNTTVVSNYTIPENVKGGGSFNGSGTNYNTQAGVFHMPVGVYNGTNYIVRVGYSEFFG